MRYVGINDVVRVTGDSTLAPWLVVQIDIEAGLVVLCDLFDSAHQLGPVRLAELEEVPTQSCECGFPRLDPWEWFCPLCQVLAIVALDTATDDEQYDIEIYYELTTEELQEQLRDNHRDGWQLLRDIERLRSGGVS